MISTLVLAFSASSAAGSSVAWATSAALWKRGLPPSAATMATYRPLVPMVGWERRRWCGGPGRGRRRRRGRRRSWAARSAAAAPARRWVGSRGDQAVVRQLGQLPKSDAGGAQDLDRRPHPEGTVFLAAKIATVAGGWVVGPDLGGSRAEPDQPEGGRLLAGSGGQAPGVSLDAAAALAGLVRACRVSLGAWPVDAAGRHLTAVVLTFVDTSGTLTHRRASIRRGNHHAHPPHAARPPARPGGVL